MCHTYIFIQLIECLFLATELRESELDLHHPSLVDAITLNYFWLRDHCRCAYCFVKNHRIINILDIPLEIKPILCKVTNEQLHIKCKNAKKKQIRFMIARLKIILFPNRQGLISTNQHTK